MRRDPFTLFVNERYISDGRRQWNDNQPLLGGQIIDDDHIAGVTYTDLNLTYSPEALKGFETYLNVQNVFDRNPPKTPIFSRVQRHERHQSRAVRRAGTTVRARLQVRAVRPSAALAVDSLSLRAPLFQPCLARKGIPHPFGRRAQAAERIEAAAAPRHAWPDRGRRRIPSRSHPDLRSRAAS